MKSISTSLAAVVLTGLVMLCGAAATAPVAVQGGTPRYDPQGRLIPPTDYREWVFLSSGLDMNYSEGPAVADHVFGNVFAPPAAYAAFKKTGVWPDRTVLILENRTGATKGSINKGGQFQTRVTGLEAHVKDTKRFKGGWGFFFLADDKPATLLPYALTCYSCHQQNAAADTTFVQFYPTLLPIATRLKTLSPSYLAQPDRVAPEK